MVKSVLLYTKPQHHIEDVAVRAVPLERDGYTHGKLDVRLAFNDASEKHVEILLCDSDGDCIWEDEASMPAKTHTFSGEAACVLLWSAESPWLYHLMIRVRDAAGTDGFILKHLQNLQQEIRRNKADIIAEEDFIFRICLS